MDLTTNMKNRIYLTKRKNDLGCKIYANVQIWILEIHSIYIANGFEVGSINGSIYGC